MAILRGTGSRATGRSTNDLESIIRQLAGGQNPFGGPEASRGSIDEIAQNTMGPRGSAASGHDSWRNTAVNEGPQAVARTPVNNYQGPQSQGAGFDLNSLLGMLGGGGGPDPSAIGAAYDPQIAAVGSAMGGVTDAYEGAQGRITGAVEEQISGLQAGLAETLAGIAETSGVAVEDIGDYFDYAKRAAEAGVPGVQKAGADATGSINTAYDDLAASLAGLPEEQVRSAQQAAGGVGTGNVAGRVAAATAPFAAAGETARAGATSRAASTQQAGENYLGNLAGAAPMEAALRQGQVSARASHASTQEERANAERVGGLRTNLAGQLSNMDIQMAQQQAELEMRQAELRGAQQRAMAEAAADVAGGTFDQMMQLAQLDATVQSPEMRAAFGLPAQSQDPLSQMSAQLGLENQSLQNQMLMQELAGAGQPGGYQEALQAGGNVGFEQYLPTLDPRGQAAAEEFRRASESFGVDPMTLVGGIDTSTSTPRDAEPEDMPNWVDNMNEVAQILAALADPDSGYMVDPENQNRYIDPMTGESMPIPTYRPGRGGLDDRQYRELARVLQG